MKIATNYNLRVVRLVFFLLFLGFSSLSAQFRMGNTLAPLSGSLYPIIYSNDAKGGFHQVATIADRDAIPALRRQQGMLCTVLDAGSGTPKTYQLLGGILNINWIEFSVLATSANFSTLTGLPTTLLGYGITDAMSTAHPANGITSTDISNWTTAFGWGNHAGLYRPISYVPAWSDITSKPTTLAGYGITDGMSTAHAANGIASIDITNWNSAFGWGNHAGLYRPISYVPAWSDITSNPFLFTSPGNDQLLKYNGTTSTWENWTPNYVTTATEADPLFTAWDKKTGINIDASQVSDFQTSVTGNAAVLANTAKVTNATHTGEVTGSDALTITDKAVTLAKMADIATARILGRNTANAGSPEELDAATVKAMLNIADNVSFNIDRPITLSGNNNTGQNLGAGGKTMSQFFEAFFFPSVAATPPTSTFTTATTTFPYSTWKSWGNPPSTTVSFNWSVTNNSLTDNTDDKAITSIKLKPGADSPIIVTPNGGNQSGTFSAIPFASTVLDAKNDFSKTYTLEVIDAQPNTVSKNIVLTMSKAIQLTYTAPTIATTLYEYKTTDENVTLNWSITPNDESVNSVMIDGISKGNTATGSTSLLLKTTDASKTYAMTVDGSIYNVVGSKNSPTVSWANRLYRGTITSAVPPSDGTFTFNDTQIKALSSENKLGGNWKATAGYDFVCGAGGQYVCFAYPDDAATPVVQYYDSNFGSWMTYSASNITVIDRPNFSNQYGYTGTNYKLVFVNVQYVSATVKIRLQ
jgi:hypothetical protein